MYNVRLGHDRRKAGINRLQPNVDETIPWPGRRVGNVLDPQTHGYIPSAVPPAVGHFECKKARCQGARTVVRACIDQRLVSPLSLFLSLAIFSLHMRFVLEGANKMARDKSSIHSFGLNNNQHLVLIPFPLFFDLYLRLSSSWTFYPDISYPYLSDNVPLFSLDLSWKNQWNSTLWNEVPIAVKGSKWDAFSLYDATCCFVFIPFRFVTRTYSK